MLPHEALDDIDAPLGRRRDVRSTLTVPFDFHFGWHDQLVGLVKEIEDFASPETGLIDGRSSAGWGLARRMAWAQTVRERTVDGAQAASLWEEAISSIAGDEGIQ